MFNVTKNKRTIKRSSQGNKSTPNETRVCLNKTNISRSFIANNLNMKKKTKNFGSNTTPSISPKSTTISVFEFEMKLEVLLSVHQSLKIECTMFAKLLQINYISFTCRRVSIYVSHKEGLTTAITHFNSKRSFFKNPNVSTTKLNTQSTTKL